MKFEAKIALVVHVEAESEKEAALAALDLLDGEKSLRPYFHNIRVVPVEGQQ